MDIASRKAPTLLSKILAPKCVRNQGTKNAPIALANAKKIAPGFVQLATTIKNSIQAIQQPNPTLIDSGLLAFHSDNLFIRANLTKIASHDGRPYRPFGDYS